MTEVEKARICHPSAILTASQPEDGYFLGSAPERPSESILELRRGRNGGTRAMTSDLIDVFRDVAIAVQSVLNATRDCCADITRAAARLDRDDYDLADDRIL